MGSRRISSRGDRPSWPSSQASRRRTDARTACSCPSAGSNVGLDLMHEMYPDHLVLDDLMAAEGYVPADAVARTNGGAWHGSLPYVEARLADVALRWICRYRRSYSANSFVSVSDSSAGAPARNLPSRMAVLRRSASPSASVLLAIRRFSSRSRLKRYGFPFHWKFRYHECEHSDQRFRAQSQIFRTPSFFLRLPVTVRMPDMSAAAALAAGRPAGLHATIARRLDRQVTLRVLLGLAACSTTP